MLYSLTSKQTVELSAYCDPWGVSAMCYWEEAQDTKITPFGWFGNTSVSLLRLLAWNLDPDRRWMDACYSYVAPCWSQKWFQAAKKWAQKRLDTTFFFLFFLIPFFGDWMWQGCHQTRFFLLFLLTEKMHLCLWHPLCALLRGKCNVTLLNETDVLAGYLEKEVNMPSVYLSHYFDTELFASIFHIAKRVALWSGSNLCSVLSRTVSSTHSYSTLSRRPC